VGFLFNLQVEVEDDEPQAAEEVQPVAVAAPQVSAATPQIDFAQAQAHAPQIRAKGLDKPSRPQNLSYTAPAEDGEAEVHAEAAASDDPFAGVGRNALCPCGSGQKFKRCHGAPGGASGYTTRAGG
ncbi:MAG TPA: SEC-C domain-containing protein, partial [Nocardioides sp.]|nr:SEC-C domain-containing protein [Nocardioides sp.]